MEKRERGRIQGLSNFFRVPPIISGTGKATNCKFSMHIYGLNRNKSPLKIREKYGRGRCQGLLKIFRAPIYRAHRAVSFAIAQLSCLARHLRISLLVPRRYGLRFLVQYVGTYKSTTWHKIDMNESHKDGAEGLTAIKPYQSILDKWLSLIHI